MLSFSSLGGPIVRLNAGKKTFIVFAKQGSKVPENTLLFFGEPEDQPAKGTISWPGEYDIDGAAIRGIGHEEGNTVSYVIEIDGTRCAFIHSPLHDWTDFELEELGDVDVLCFPTDNPMIVQKIIDEIDPRVLIPLQTGTPDKHAECLKMCGAAGREAVDKFDIKGSLPQDVREVVVLEAK